MMTLETLAETIQKDFNDIRERMVTKDDLRAELKGFATKDDLAGFATRQDIRDELRGFASKQDLKSGLDSLRDDILSTTRSELYDVKTELLGEMRKYRYAREIDGLRDRVVRVEKVVGISTELEPEG
jgi:hypothetical protein